MGRACVFVIIYSINFSAIAGCQRPKNWWSEDQSPAQRPAEILNRIQKRVFVHLTVLGS
jgi:hypothetical protein